MDPHWTIPITTITAVLFQWAMAGTGTLNDAPRCFQLLLEASGSIWKHLEECEMEKLLKRARFSGGCNLIYDTPPPAGAPPPCWLLLPPLFHVIVVVCSVRDTWSKHYRKDGRKYHNKEPIHPSIHPSIHPWIASIHTLDPWPWLIPAPKWFITFIHLKLKLLAIGSFKASGRMLTGILRGFFWIGDERMEADVN